MEEGVSIMFFKRNKDIDDYVDQTHFSHLGSPEIRPMHSQKVMIAYGAIAACLLFHGQIPNLLLFLIIVVALSVIFRG